MMLAWFIWLSLGTSRAMPIFRKVDIYFSSRVFLALAMCTSMKCRKCLSKMGSASDALVQVLISLPKNFVGFMKLSSCCDAGDAGVGR